MELLAHADSSYISRFKKISAPTFSIFSRIIMWEVYYTSPRRKSLIDTGQKNCIVVLDLISQSPMSDKSPHEITVEKLLVDMIAEKSIAATFSPAELPAVFQNVRESCRIDRHRLERYAGRRGRTEQVNTYMGDS
jgi:hypothetical protein